MKTQIHLGCLSLATLLCLNLIAIPSMAGTLYGNGPFNGTVDSWTINSGFVVSDTFTLTSNSTVRGFDFTAWAFPGDTPLTVDWSISSAANGGTVFGSGTASLTTTSLGTNQYGYAIDGETVTGLNLPLYAGGDWLNLGNATTAQDNPLYWDENSGAGCTSPGCPSQASENSVGSIPSESFTISGDSGGGTTPEPSTIMLLGSGIMGLTVVMRRRWMGAPVRGSYAGKLPLTETKIIAATTYDYEEVTMKTMGEKQHAVVMDIQQGSLPSQNGFMRTIRAFALAVLTVGLVVVARPTTSLADAQPCIETGAPEVINGEVMNQFFTCFVAVGANGHFPAFNAWFQSDVNESEGDDLLAANFPTGFQQVGGEEY